VLLFPHNTQIKEQIQYFLESTMIFYKPMLSKPVSKPFTDKDWIFEVKWDGFRAIAYVKETFSLRSRNGRELIYNFPEIIELKQLAHNVVVDGEIIIMRGGKEDFEAMQQRSQLKSALEIDRQMRAAPATYIVFDILEKDGISLVNLPLIERKQILKESVKDGVHVIVSDFVEEKGEAYFKIVTEKGLEGIIAKEKNSSYEQGQRTGNWQKIKNLKTCDCVIFGYTAGEGSRASTFGALVVGLYDMEGNPIYVSSVGIAFDQQLLESLLAQMENLRTKDQAALLKIESYVGKITWIEPKIVCEVVFMTVTSDLKLRHPRFSRLRTDKSPIECKIDQIL
jgi:bifunctional non-homologous end joining protein LigD